jgi:hypothetical protein
MNLQIATAAGEILKVAYSSVLATVAVSVVFALAVVGLSRSGELRRAGRQAAAGAYTAMAVCSFALCAGAAVYGLILVGQKS